MGDSIRVYFILAFIFGLLAVGIFIYPGVPATGLGFFIKVLVLLAFAVYLWIVLQELQVNVITSTQPLAVGDTPEEDPAEEMVTVKTVPESEPAGDVLSRDHLDEDLAELDATRAYHTFLQRVLEIIQETFFCHTVMVYVAHLPQNAMVLQDHRQTSRASLRKKVEIDAGIIGQAFAADTTVLKNQSDEDAELPVNYYQDPTPAIQSFLSVPLHYKNSGIGVLAIDQLARGSFSEQDGALLKKYAQLISSVMVQFDVLDHLSDQRNLYARLSKINAQLSETDNVEALFRQSVKVSRELFDYDSLAIILLQSQNSAQAEIATIDGDLYEHRTGYRFELQDSLLHEVIKTGNARLFPTLHPDEDNGQHIPELRKSMIETKSLVIVPIVSHTVIYGAIILESRAPGKYTSEVQDILQILGSVFGAGLNRFYLYRYMKSIATRDGLTNLHNHRAFKERLAQEIQRSKRYQTPFTLCIADIDKFKRINDTYGHLFGDFVLQETAQLIQTSVRSIDMVARYGGEEFAIILVNAIAKDVVSTAKRIRMGIKEHVFIRGEVREQITISLGLAEFPAHASDLDTLISHADAAMYEVKKLGGDSVHTYNESIRIQEA